MSLLPQEIVNKRYRIVSLLGSGPYGSVYRAWDLTAKQDVAIKEYLDPSVETQKQFRAEARRLSRLQHPQLAAVRDHFALENSGQYMVSDYIDGVNLQEILVQYGSLPADLIGGWLQAACQPLAYLHQKKHLHLNIKPANIRLTPAGDVFLVDSGLYGLGIRPHTDGYGSPEQQAQTEVGPAADIFSMGATLYTALTNRTPPNALARESGLEDLIPAREVNSDVEPYLSLVATRAMSLRADSRYETAVDFANALQRPSGHPTPQSSHLRRTQEQHAAVSPPLPRHPPSRRRQMERRTIVGLSALLIIVLAIGLIFGVFNLGGRSAEISEAEATATLESAVLAALTAIAPTNPPTPLPTETPTPTPQPLIADTGARMLFIPGGVFRMGDDDSDANDQKPAHLLRMDPFFIDETEVTNGEYALCVAAEVCDAPDSPNATYHSSYYGETQFDNYPVIFVSWFDANAFCKWRDARLPTEAEWEQAASFDPVDGLKTLYPWGDEFEGTNLNYCDLNCPRDFHDTAVDDGHKDTAAVGNFSNGRSPMGVFDMAGNVMEWVNDWYDARYYRDSSDTNPLGPLDGQFKSIRGGSWLSPVEDVTTTARDSFDPTVSRANLGFRCATTPK